jgi:hypothetical protein
MSSGTEKEAMIHTAACTVQYYSVTCVLWLQMYTHRFVSAKCSVSHGLLHAAFIAFVCATLG